jgi:hypothetical protein
MERQNDREFNWEKSKTTVEKGKERMAVESKR